MARNAAFIPEEKINKAMEVFWCKGYAATSLSDLTEAMELNKSSLYNSFKDKHSLFIAALKAYGAMVEKEYLHALTGKTDAMEQLDGLIDKVAGGIVEKSRSCLAVKTAFEMAAEDEEAGAVVKTGNDKTVAWIMSLVSTAQASGAIKGERDAETMAHFLFNAFAGLRQSYIIYGSKTLVNKMAAELKTFLRA